MLFSIMYCVKMDKKADKTQRCKNCGEIVTKDMKFCPKCGTEVIQIEKKNPPRQKKWLSVAVVLVVLCIGVAIGTVLKRPENLPVAGKIKGSSEIAEEYQAKFDKIFMNESQQSAYQSSMKKLKTGLKENDSAQVEDAKQELDLQYQQYETENITSIEESKNEIEAYTPDRLLDAEQQLVGQYKHNADTFLTKKDYRKALEEYEKCTVLYENIEKSQAYQFKVEQVDGLSFPKVRLYVSAYQDQSDISVMLEDRGLVLKELINDTYQDTKITKVSMLDEKESLNTCLVADVSGSMYNQIGTVKDAMTNFVNCLQYEAGDQCALVTFDSDVSLNKDFTGNGQEIGNEIQNLYVGNSTALYDALYVAVCKASEAEGAKCVIAFTDGYDNDSTKTENDVIEAAGMYGVPVYLIGIGDEIDIDVLSRISAATGGYFQNIYDGSMMQEIYNSIYRKNKELYLVEYTSQLTDKDALQNLYLTYDDETVFMRCESSFQPSQLQAEETEYKQIIQDSGISNADIEDEVLRIRAVYNDIVAKRDNHNYLESSPADGVTEYRENGDLRCVIINKGINNSPYARYYYYEGGKLIFAYLEADDSHRLYFKNDKLFRWRYASNAVAYTEAENHDNEDSAEFRTWEAFVLNEAYLY